VLKRVVHIVTTRILGVKKELLELCKLILHFGWCISKLMRKFLRICCPVRERVLEHEWEEPRSANKPLHDIQTGLTSDSITCLVRPTEPTTQQLVTRPREQSAHVICSRTSHESDLFSNMEFHVLCGVKRQLQGTGLPALF
jgi:hypothetical protein